MIGSMPCAHVCIWCQGLACDVKRVLVRRSPFGVKAGETSAWIAAVNLDQASYGASAAESLAAACRSVPSGQSLQSL